MPAVQLPQIQKSPTDKPAEKPVAVVQRNKQLTNFLQLLGKEEESAEKVKLDFHWIKLTWDELGLLAGALASEACKRVCNKGLSINLQGNLDLDYGLLFDALKSGNCPDDLELILIHSKVNGEAILKLVQAVESDNFPKGCQIDLTACGIGTLMEAKLNEAISKKGSDLKVINVAAKPYLAAKTEIKEESKQDPAAAVTKPERLSKL